MTDTGCNQFHRHPASKVRERIWPLLDVGEDICIGEIVLCIVALPAANGMAYYMSYIQISVLPL